MPIVSVENFKARKFDYLVIGGGTAGLALATRLSENKDVHVGVIEAGGHDNNVPEINVPGFMGRTITNPTYDWTFFSVPQTQAGGRSVLQPRGKGLGGSSLNNFMGMFRPSKEELDALEELGNEGWNWASLLEYMKKSETMQPSDVSPLIAERYAATPQPEFHGTSGPIKKSFPTVWPKPHGLLFDAAEALGVPRNGEMCNGSNRGSMSSFNSVDARTSKRSYSASEYYEPNSNRPNLLVLVNAHVCKVIFERAQNGAQKATGVEIMHGGTKVALNDIANEVIISGGAFQTPQILELSGIGNPKILQKHGITPLIDLPGVGENLQDHVCVVSIVEIDSKFDETMDVLSEAAHLEKHEKLYKEQKGLLASAPAQGFIFLSSNDLGSAEDIRSWQSKADAEFAAQMTATESPTLRSGFEKQYNLQMSWLQKGHLAQAEILNYIGHQPRPTPLPVPGKRYASLVSALMHPLSRGTVHIVSSDPLAPPAIDPNYFANEADLDVLLSILQFTTKLFETSPMAEIVRSYALPSPEVMKSKEGLADRLREFIKDTCGPVFHPVGTAAMLPRSDGGVVDKSLKVYGTTNLRVVDVSILPMEVSGHIQSLAYAIAEKAADIIKTERLME